MSSTHKLSLLTLAALAALFGTPARAQYAASDSYYCLDTFAGELAGARFDSVTVQGHIDAARIGAVGLSESEPVTQPEQCKGKAGAAVIACLQPDRPVVIEVAASR